MLFGLVTLVILSFDFELLFVGNFEFPLVGNFEYPRPLVGVI